MNPALSIVVPAYNESERIVAPLSTLVAFAVSSPDPVEIIVVDDGSSDDTARIVREKLD